MERERKLLYGEKITHFDTTAELSDFSSSLLILSLGLPVPLLSVTEEEHFPFEFEIVIGTNRLVNNTMTLGFYIQLDFDKEYLNDINDFRTICQHLSDPSEYLPDDCLTLHFEVIFMNKYCEESFIMDDVSVLDEMVVSSLIVEESNTSFNNELCKLRLNSEVGKCLGKTSSVFRDMFDSTTADDTTEYLQFRIEEIKGFAQIFRIINAAAEIRVRGITDICEIYTTADKYDVPLAMEACRDFFRSFLCMKNSPGESRSYLPKILELAENFNDEILKQIVEDFNKREENPMEEDGDLNLKWILEESSFTYEYRLIRSDKSTANGREEFDFYQ